MSYLLFEKLSGLKKKQHYSDDEDEDNDDDDEQENKSKTKGRGQVFAKPQEETATNQDIKSMFAASKARNVQRQEQVFHPLFLLLLNKNVFPCLESKR